MIPDFTQDQLDALVDMKTHRNSWNYVFDLAKQAAVYDLPDIDDKGYVEHERKALMRVLDAFKEES
jgi:hypothetical protein